MVELKRPYRLLPSFGPHLACSLFMLRHQIAWLAVVLVWFFSDAGFAQQTSQSEDRATALGEQGRQAQPTGESSSPAATTEPDGVAAAEATTEAALYKTPRQWSEAYERARAALLAGAFSEAAEMFRALASDPQAAPSDQLRAEEMAFLSSHWAAKGLRLAPEDAASASTSRPRVRTTDELATLYIYSVLYGLGTGAWLAVLTEPEEVAAGVLPALGLGALGSAGVALLDSEKLPYGAAHNTVTGIQVGFGQGLLWMLWNQERAPKADEMDKDVTATLVWLLTTAGAAGGYAIGRWVGSTPGDASYVGSGALWGAALAGFTAVAFTPEDVYRDDNLLLGAAVGLNAGIAATLLSASRVSPTVARSRFLDLGALAGGVVFAGIYVSAANRDIQEQPLAGSAAAGIAAGLVTTWFLTDGMREPPDDSAAMTALPKMGLAPIEGGMALNVSGII